MSDASSAAADDGPVRRRTLVRAGVAAAAAGALSVGLRRTSQAQAESVTVLQGSFASPLRGGATTGWVTVYPRGIDPSRPAHPDGGRVPVAVALHGRGASHRTVLDLGLHRALGRAVADGMPPFVLAAVDGGDTYWHARHDGTDSGRMVLEEFLPRLALSGLAASPRHHVGLLGWSMGGFGALHLAATLGTARTAAVAVASPALWTAPGLTPAGAFDDAEDFAATDPLRRTDALRGLPVRVDCGLSDPFLAAARTLAASLSPPAEGGFTAGGHDDAYWRALADAQVRFLGRHLRPEA